MLSKCANPECQARFRYLHEGKVFMADWMGGSAAESDNACWRRTEMYWLCDTCSRRFVLGKKGGSVVPLEAGLVKDHNGILLREIRITR